MLCHRQVKDVNDIHKDQEIFEAKEVEMSKTQIGNECMSAIAAGEEALWEGVQGGSAIAAEKMKRVHKMTKKDG